MLQVLSIQNSIQSKELSRQIVVCSNCYCLHELFNRRIIYSKCDLAEMLFSENANY